MPWSERTIAVGSSSEAAPASSISSRAGRVDRLVDPHDLVARVVRVVRGMLGVEPVPPQVPDVVGAHEVDAEEVEVGLELEERRQTSAIWSTWSISRCV